MKYVQLFVSISSLMIIILISIAVTLNSNIQIASAVEYLQYGNPVLGIKIKYPSNFDYPEDEIEKESASIDISSPSNWYPIKGFFISINNFNKTEMKNPNLLREYAFKTVEEHTVKGDEIDGSSTTTLLGSPAIETEYSWIFNINDKVIGKIISTIKDNTGYTFLFEISEKEYDNYYPIVKEMIDSFEIVKTPSSIINSKE